MVIFFLFLVPHQKSKKLTELLSNPPAHNASPSLLMIAPLSDERYRCQSTNNVINPVMMTLHRTRTCGPLAQDNPSVLARSRVLKVDQDVGIPRLQRTDCLEQLSALAAISWSDRTAMTENLRRICKHTSTLASADSFPSTEPPSSIYRASAPFRTIGNAPPAPAPSQEFFNPPLSSFYSDSFFKPTAASHCVCAICHMAKRTSSRVVDVPTKIKSSVVARSQTGGHGTSQTRYRLKRSHSPSRDFSIYHSAAKRLMTSQRFDCTLPVDAAYDVTEPRMVSNFFIHPSLQVTSQARDFGTTPSFERHCYVSAYPSNGNIHTTAKPLNHFSKFLPTQLSNAIK